MKKVLIWVVAICLLLECFAGVAAADSGVDNSATSGVDVVVVLDMSGSMTTLGEGVNRRPGNDDNGFRIDATAMLVGMVDMDGSRVGIVPFAGTVLDAVKELTVVDTARSREDFIADLYGRIAKKRGDNTNIGAALMTALHMLDSREDKSNRPMIVLLTDGVNALTGDVGVKESYRWENDRIVYKGRETYKASGAVTPDKVTQEAVECAIALSVPIYTVSLTEDPYRTPDGGMSLSSISEKTKVQNGCKWAKTKEEAKDLPGYFAKVLADKIGSSVQMATAPSKVDGTAKTYEVPVPVLNESIREINVILPVKKDKANLISGINAETIKVLNAHGEIQTTGMDDGVTVLKNKSSSFAMIKIRKPVRGSTGMWKIQFDSDDDPKNISFNFLYNYNIKLNAEVNTDRGDGEYYKSDKLRLSAFFADEEGNRSTDPSLYADHTNEPGFEDWMTIHAQWQLFEVDNEGRTAGQPIRNGEMAPQSVPLQFVAEVDLTHNTPKAGSYKLVFTANGAGLIRTVEVPITLKNHVPQADNYQETITVNSTTSGEEHTWTVEGTSGTMAKKASEIVRDADPEDQAQHLVFNIVAEPGIEQAAEMVLENDIIRYTTKLDPAGSGIKEGQAKFRLEYNDGDQGGSGFVYVMLYTESDWDIIKNTYEPEMDIDGECAVGFSKNDAVFKKNSPVHIAIKLKRKDGTGYDNGETLRRLANTLSITNQATDESIVQAPEFALNGDTLEYTVESTGNKEAVWKVTAKLGRYDELIKEVRIPNQFEPEITVIADRLTINCSGEKVPSFLQGLIGKDTEEDDPIRKIEVSSLFADQDNDQLDYSEPVFKTIDGLNVMDPADITAVHEGDDESKEYTIQVTGQQTSLFNFSYQSKMEITATDGDGRQQTYEQKITVVDLYNKMLTYLVVLLAFIILLVILFLIIHQIRKPRFPMLNLTIREEPSLYESGSETLSPVKTPTNVNAMGVDMDMAARHNLSLELLQNVIIKPVRSMLAVGVVCKKSIPGQEVLLDDVRLKTKKLYTWKIEQELCIHNERSESMVVIKLENRDTSEEEDVLMDFGGSDDWADAGDGDNMAQAGKKRSRKVARKAKPVEANDSFSDSNDDFDF